MAVYVYRQIPKCEKCGHELNYSNIPSQNGKTMFVFTPEINDKIQSCEKCGYKYESNNNSFDDLSFMQKILYILGFVILPDFDRIKKVHSEPDPVIILLYIFSPIYWVFILFFNAFLIFPLRIPSHIVKAIKYSDNYRNLNNNLKLEKNDSILNKLITLVFHIFSFIFLPLVVINFDLMERVSLLVMFVYPVLILIFNVLRDKFKWKI